MENSRRYKSVHEYMDAFFGGGNPTDKEIKKAKEEYRKLYQKYYRESYKEDHTQITFRVSKQQYQELKNLAKERDVKVTTLAKQRTLKTDNSTNIRVKIQFSELLDVIEQSIYHKRVIDPISILKQLETIEEQL